MLDIDIFIAFLLSLSRCVSLIETGSGWNLEVEKRMQFPTRIIAASAWRHTSLWAYNWTVKSNPCRGVRPYRRCWRSPKRLVFRHSTINTLLTRESGLCGMYASGKLTESRSGLRFDSGRSALIRLELSCLYTGGLCLRWIYAWA